MQQIESQPKALSQSGQYGLNFNLEIIEQVISKNNVAIRLTDKRWARITEEHCELVGQRAEVFETILQPERILLGGDGELIALRELERGKHLVAIYREHASDGVIIPAFLTRRVRSLQKRRQVWP